jgi:hypothetical protein
MDVDLLLKCVRKTMTKKQNLSVPIANGVEIKTFNY